PGMYVEMRRSVAPEAPAIPIPEDFMSNFRNISRRGFVAHMAGLGAMLATPTRLLGRDMLPTRPIPATGEMIPIVGFGSTKSVLESPTEGTAPIANVIRMLREYGGTLLDTSPRAEEIDLEFGRVLQQAEAEAPLFIAAKIYTNG